MYRDGVFSHVGIGRQRVERRYRLPVAGTHFVFQRDRHPGRINLVRMGIPIVDVGVGGHAQRKRIALCNCQRAILVIERVIGCIPCGQGCAGRFGIIRTNHCTLVVHQRYVINGIRSHQAGRIGRIGNDPVKHALFRSVVYFAQAARGNGDHTGRNLHRRGSGSDGIVGVYGAYGNHRRGHRIRKAVLHRASSHGVGNRVADRQRFRVVYGSCRAGRNRNADRVGFAVINGVDSFRRKSDGSGRNGYGRGAGEDHFAVTTYCYRNADRPAGYVGITVRRAVNHIIGS